jgi:hypothetical protein
MKNATDTTALIHLQTAATTVRCGSPFSEDTASSDLAVVTCHICRPSLAVDALWGITRSDPCEHRAALCPQSLTTHPSVTSPIVAEMIERVARCGSPWAHDAAVWGIEPFSTR